MDSNIQIVEKPNWVSLEDVMTCVRKAHDENIKKGIRMSHIEWPIEKVQEFMGANPFVSVALDGEKVVGTACFFERERKSWYFNGRYAYSCFDSVLPEYSGQGIFKQLDCLCEQKALERGLEVMIRDTNAENHRMIDISKKNGYRLVNFKFNEDHFYVIMAKWFKGCPYSKLRCKFKFWKLKKNTICQLKK